MIKRKFENIRELLNEIEVKYNDLLECISGSKKKILPIKICKYGDCHSSIGYYKSNLTSCQRYFSNPSIDGICDYAIKETKEKIELAKQMHEENKEALKNNMNIRKALETFMRSIGMSDNYTTYFYKTPRSKSKTSQKHNAGWVDDMSRCIIISDSFDTSIKYYGNHLQEIEKYRISEKKKENDLKQQKENELLKQKEVIDAIAFLTSSGFKANIDYTLDNCIEVARVIKLSEEEYMSENAENIIFGDNSNYEILGEPEIIGKWKYGTEEKITVKSKKSGKIYEGIFNQSDRDIDFEDANGKIIWKEKL